jgi:hypothetical protein
VTAPVEDARRRAVAAGRARGDVTEHGREVIATPSARDDHAERLARRHANRSSGLARRVKPGREIVCVGDRRARTRGTLAAREHRRPQHPPPSPPSRSRSDQPRMRRLPATTAVELSGARFAARPPCSRVSGASPRDGAQPVLTRMARSGTPSPLWGAWKSARRLSGGLTVGRAAWCIGGASPHDRG